MNHPKSPILAELVEPLVTYEKKSFVEQILSPKTLQRMMLLSGGVLVLGLVGWLWSIGLFKDPEVVAVLMGITTLAVLGGGIGLGAFHKIPIGRYRTDSVGITGDAAQSLVLRCPRTDHADQRWTPLDSRRHLLRDLCLDSTGTTEPSVRVCVCGRNCDDRHAVLSRSCNRSFLGIDAARYIPGRDRLGMCVLVNNSSTRPKATSHETILGGRSIDQESPLCWAVCVCYWVVN